MTLFNGDAAADRAAQANTARVVGRFFAWTLLSTAVAFIWYLLND